ncbi:MAG TPA: hypothetical protein VKX41_16905 [Alloacidobacterium sp.]|nr:hypothetical protein [Alloacidobacterium sp.]
MRSVLTVIGIMLLSETMVFPATEKIPNTQDLARMEARAAQASAENRLFAYAELIHISTDLVVTQMQAGDEEQASVTLECVRTYASKADVQAAKNTRKLKNMEKLLEHSEFRLRELQMGAPLDIRPLLEKALKQVTEVQSALLLRIFER